MNRQKAENEVKRLTRRVDELLAYNNKELERRREAENTIRKHLTCHDGITTTTTINISWWDRLKVLVGYRLNVQTSISIKFVGGTCPFKVTDKETDTPFWLWWPRPNWMKPKGGCYGELKKLDKA